MKLPVAKILNIWGRAEGLMVFSCLFLLGIIVLASCTGPDGYAAGYVMYYVGYNAIYLILDVFIVDTSDCAIMLSPLSFRAHHLFARRLRSKGSAISA
jgi:hypothetical protein